jgi:hypothetical protein
VTTAAGNLNTPGEAGGLLLKGRGISPSSGLFKVNAARIGGAIIISLIIYKQYYILINNLIQEIF